mmetsp:Transcript_5566/g.9553  ORF Transcript_5566/g.9553 Transcript_5566/m.9553 type:complete len:108 (+) Transcript_5566:20-343(+)
MLKFSSKTLTQQNLIQVQKSRLNQIGQATGGRFGGNSTQTFKPVLNMNQIRQASTSSMEMTGLQMNNKMFITKQVLDQQVSIIKNKNIPSQLKQSDEYVYRHMGNSN